MRYFLALPLSAAVAVALPTTSNQAIDIARNIVARAPPEANAVLKSVTTSGTGCSPGSSIFLIKDDATLAFDSFSVDSTSVPQASKKCLVEIDLQLDAKWKYTINTLTDVRGYADKGGAAFKAVYTVGGTTSESRGTIKATGANGGNYLLHLSQAGATSAYGGGKATIALALAYQGDSSNLGVVTVDSIDVGFAYSK